MFCVRCGCQNPDSGRFCQKCGTPLARTRPELIQAALAAKGAPTEKELLIEILKTDPKPNECHRCGAAVGLARHEFGIAKVLSMKRDWGETIAQVGLSAAASVVTAPLTGFGVLSWKRPNKTASYSLFKAELVLCRPCLEWAWRTRHGMELKDEAYRLHPWAELARGIGYDTYLSAYEIESLKPAR